jgi:hypothetical protein
MEDIDGLTLEMMNESMEYADVLTNIVSTAAENYLAAGHGVDLNTIKLGIIHNLVRDVVVAGVCGEYVVNDVAGIVADPTLNRH